MPVDPRLNCAAEICCPPPAAREAKESIVRDLVVPIDISIRVLDKEAGGVDLVRVITDRMTELDIEFAPGALMRVIRDLADHPDRKGNGTKDKE